MMRFRKGRWLYIPLGFIILILVGVVYLKSIKRKPKEASHKPELQFSAEKIEMRISRKEVEVKGYYYFRNNSSQETIHKLLIYPFPVDSTHNFPYIISVYYLSSEKKIPYGPKAPVKSIYFPVDLPSGSTTAVVVEYRQSIQANDAKYILHTTKYWGHPLESADYLIWVPKGFQDVKLSYRPTKVETLQSQIKFTIEKRDFLPHKDLEIEWK